MAISEEKLKKWAKKGKLEKLVNLLRRETDNVHNRFLILNAIVEIGNDQAINELVKILSDGVPKQGAAGALVNIGSPAVDTLIKCLSKDDAETRKWSANALGRIGDPRAVAPLIKALGDEDESVRKFTVHALDNMGTQAAAQFIDALDNDDENIRIYSVQILSKINAPNTIDAFIKALGNSNEQVRKYAAMALTKMPDIKAAAPLIQILGDENEDLINNACDALVKIGTPAIDSLIKAIDSKNPGVRRNAVKILDKLWWKPSKDETGLKFYIVKANLEKYLDMDTTSIGFGTKASENDDEEFSIKLVDPLIKALGNKEYQVESAARGALTQIGTQAVDKLINALAQDENQIREKVIEILGKIGDNRAVEPLIKALENEEKNIPKKAADALGEIGDTSAVAPLIKALENVEIDIREYAAQALGAIGDARAVDPLIRALGDSSRKVVIGVSRALKKFYKSGNLTPEKKKAILELKGKKIADHYDYNQPPPLDCALPPRHTDSPAVHFNL